MNNVSQDVDDWLSAARDGSRDALGSALESCRRYLLSIARNELWTDLQSKGGASDLVQDTFLEAHRSFSHFHGRSEVELRAWLRHLLHHRAAKFGRHFRSTQKRRIERESYLSSDGDSQPAQDDRLTPSVILMASEQAQQLRKVLELLPDDYRRVITLRYVEQCSFEEVGRQMNRTPNAARLLWLRAIEQVKKQLQPTDGPK